MAQKIKEPKPLKTKTRSSSKAATKKSGSAYALLLRGVNVGKGNTLPMANLRAMLEEVGVLRGQERIDDVGGDLVELHPARVDAVGPPPPCSA